MRILALLKAPASTISTTTTTTALLPTAASAARLFVAGTTIGPMVDGLHNQCLLKYEFAPIIVDWPSALTSPTISNPNYYEPHLFASSWIVPPLLGVTYIILGNILPRFIQKIIDLLSPSEPSSVKPTEHAVVGDLSTDGAVPTPLRTTTSSSMSSSPALWILLSKAVVAVISTAAIVKLSEHLILHPQDESIGGILHNPVPFEGSDLTEQHLMILITVAIVQWAYLDGTLASLLAASITAVLGPLMELPFVAGGFWTYLPQAGDIYLPLRTLVDWIPSSAPYFQQWFGNEYQSLALNSVTGPCYFAVTMDAIALGRWFDASTTRPVDPQFHSELETMDTLKPVLEDATHGATAASATTTTTTLVPTTISSTTPAVPSRSDATGNP